MTSSGRIIAAQVYKVIFVMKLTDLTHVPHIARELMMVKVCPA